jgi:hypothetical protein
MKSYQVNKEGRIRRAKPDKRIGNFGLEVRLEKKG